MTLTHLFKAQAIFAWLWVAMFWFAPGMAAQGPGWEMTAEMHAFAQMISVPLFAIGIISWMAPSWLGDNLKKLGMLMGVYINALFIAVQAFHISTDAANFDPLAMISTLIFIALFYWKCRA
ncbi:MAG TPA: hypothetical protein EYP92_04755 [Candidatus Thioglobus sp.]|jgi:hypothetical protein|nr:hypothetical protein [Candidatus Thioglobus sp.]HIL42859.1 hypothetical protein [Gammaproteobacteria bacterium]